MRYSIVSALLLAAAAVSWSAPAEAQQRAFPECEGSGCAATGGRGGILCFVTNLNDDGPGSLRDCGAGSTPRTIIFRVCGTISLQTQVFIGANATVAGQTACGGGIQLKRNESAGGLLRLISTNVIMRYMRLRKGFFDDGGSQSGDTVSMFQNSGNIVVDQSSIYWTMDENVQQWTNPGTPISNFTLSRSIVAEPLATHPVNWITGAQEAALAEGMTNIDGHHNYLANSSHRNPLWKHKSGRFVSNIIYNTSFRFTHISTALGDVGDFDFMNNLYKRGGLGGSFPEIIVYVAGGSPSLHITGNVGPNQADPSGDNWATMVWQTTVNENGAASNLLSTAYRRLTPLAQPTFPINATPALDLPAEILPTVGASRRLDCDGTWVMNRDTTDVRVVGDFSDGGGIVPTTEDDVGGHPTIATTPGPCADADNDGMPDVWEVAVGSNPNVANNNGTDLAEADSEIPDYYTNLELYLNGMLLTSPSFASCGLLTPTAGGTPPTQWELPYDVTYGQKVWVECGDMRVILGADATGEPDASCPVDETGATCDDDLWFAPTAQVRVTGGGQAPRWESVPVVCGVSGGCPSGQGSTFGWVGTRGTADLSAYTLDEVGTIRARYCVDPEADGTCSNGTTAWIVQAFEAGGTIAP